MNTILVCDDERDIVSAIRIYLNGEGYRVLEAYSGVQALELMARVKAQLRRYTRFMGMAQKKEEEGRNYIIGGLELNEDTIEFSVDGNPVKLTPIEFKILALLMKNPGRVFSAEEIYERVWNEKAINTDTIMVHVRNIRDKIEINPREPKYLKVVWGVGYKIEKQP